MNKKQIVISALRIIQRLFVTKTFNLLILNFERDGDGKILGVGCDNWMTDTIFLTRLDYIGRVYGTHDGSAW